ncbi:MAG: hypothetical protein PSV26_09555 [Polaromonas sp.]|uniref:hypothetical protein n=1 Tax=Polaromonas sp. TaxID=1869339 RepID=UPI0024889EF4|nr:hypothetical protein [Polaromonas sp.]MDI1237713.1 hypothetical protein [Polaromonas sp.]MDI1340021.1 hypothetical protein [Polaromonas sp.]
MSTPHAEAVSRLSAHHDSMSNQHVSSDFMALAAHMNDCQRSRGRFFALRAALESLHATASPRIVTTGALFVCCGVALLAVV